MAARIKTKKYTLTASPASLTTILNNPNDAFISTLVTRAASGNAGTTYWKDSSGGDDGGYLEPGDAVAFDLVGKFLSTNDLWFYGTANDILYMTLAS